MGKKTKKKSEKQTNKTLKVDSPPPPITNELKPTNKLEFSTSRNPKKNRTEYYWTVRNARNGKIIGASSELYSKKVYAIRNALALMGYEIMNGTHFIEDVSDSEQVRAEWELTKAKELEQFEKDLGL